VALKAQDCLDAMMSEMSEGQTVLDIGSAHGNHSMMMRGWGLKTTTMDRRFPADIRKDFMDWDFGPHDRFDAIWASHVLEHQRNPGAFIDRMRIVCRSHGWLAITVPAQDPRKLVGGHLTLWTPGQLVYNLVRSGIDCADARLFVRGYDISILVKNTGISDLDILCDLHDANGDLEKLAPYFPAEVHQYSDGWLGYARPQQHAAR